MTEAAEAPTSPVTEENESSPEPDTKGYQRFRLIPGEEVHWRSHLRGSPSLQGTSQLCSCLVSTSSSGGARAVVDSQEDASFILRVLENAILLGNVDVHDHHAHLLGSIA